MKILHVEEAEHVAGYQIRLRFNDGTEGIADLAVSLDGPVFEPLRDPEVFKSFKIEGHTVAWPGGADLAPEYLRNLVGKAHTTSRGR